MSRVGVVRVWSYSLNGVSRVGVVGVVIESKVDKEQRVGVVR